MRALVSTTTGSLGYLYPLLAVAVELKRRGHTVVFGTSTNHRKIVESIGLSFGVVRPEMNYSTLNLLRPGVGFDSFQDHVEFNIGAMYDDLAALSSDVAVLVSTRFVPAARILAASREIP